MGETKFVGSLLLLLVFAVSIISYATNFASDNNANVSLSDDDDFTSLSSDLEGNITQFNTETNQSSKAFFESEITEGDETTRTGGQFKVGMGDLISGAKVIVNIIFVKIFGSDVGFAVFATVIIAFLVYFGYRLIWQTWKGGFP